MAKSLFLSIFRDLKSPLNIFVYMLLLLQKPFLVVRKLFGAVKLSGNIIKSGELLNQTRCVFDFHSGNRV